MMMEAHAIQAAGPAHDRAGVKLPSGCSRDEQMARLSANGSSRA